jgi:cell division protein FtsW
MKRKQIQKRRTHITPDAEKRKHISLLVGVPMLLTSIGLFFIFEASSVTAFRLIGNSFHYFQLQMMWFGLGLAAMTFFALFDYRKLYYFAFPALLFTLVTLILVLIPGIGSHVLGARRWINLGPFNFQPTETAKFSVILYLCSWFLYKERERFLSFLLLLGSIIGLIMIQPDMGTAIIIFSLFVSIYYFSGEDVKYLLMLIPASFAGFLLLIATSSYRMRRFLAFLNPNSDPEGIGYHIRQIFISLSSGGIFGKGFSSSRQKYQFLPEAHTDSIFAIIGEEVGFIGSFMLIMVYAFLMYLVLRTALHAKDRFGKLLASSIFCLISLQLIINLGGMVGIMPLTGVPLPFVSYGGSSLLVFYALLGIVISVARR